MQVVQNQPTRHYPCRRLMQTFQRTFRSDNVVVKGCLCDSGVFSFFFFFSFSFFFRLHKWGGDHLDYRVFGGVMLLCLAQGR
jgi:hypothetical protein